MIRSTIHTLTAGAALAAAAVLAPIAAGDVTIADLAPRDAVVVLSVDDYAAAKAAFERTGFHDAWMEPSIQEWFEEATKDMMAELSDAMDQIDADVEDLAPPEGPAGMALWLQPPAEGEFEPSMQLLVVGDFGDEGADKMYDMLLAAIDEGETEGEVIVDRDELKGVEILTLTEPKADEEEDADADADDDWEDWEDWEEPSGPAIEEVHVARSGSYILATTSKDRIERSIERLAGDDLESVRLDREFQTAVSRLGDHDGYAVVLTRPLLDLARAMEGAQDDDGFGAAPPIMTYLDALGVSEVSSAAIGVKLDGDKGMMQSRGLVRAGEMRGVLALFDAPTVPFEPPAFISADVAEVMMYQVRFSEVFNIARAVMAQMPPEVASQAGMLGMVEPMVGPLLAQLGPQLYIATTYERPFSATSQKMLVALKVKDEVALSGFLAQQAAAVGLQGREFQGSQIWTMPEGGNPMMPIPMEGSLGLGYGHLFIGATPQVEGALRQAAAPGGATLASDERFRRVVEERLDVEIERYGLDVLRLDPQDRDGWLEVLESATLEALREPQLELLS